MVFIKKRHYLAGLALAGLCSLGLAGNAKTEEVTMDSAIEAMKAMIAEGAAPQDAFSTDMLAAAGLIETGRHQDYEALTEPDMEAPEHTVMKVQETEPQEIIQETTQEAPSAVEPESIKEKYKMLKRDTNMSSNGEKNG